MPRYLKCAVKSMKEDPSLRWTRLVFGELWYSVSLCFWVIVEKVSFLWRLVLVIWPPLSSVVSAEGSEVMLAVGVGDGVGGRAVGCAVLLKKDAVGKKISSVFDFLSPFPVCISRPSSLKVSFMISHPAIMSSLVLKGKLPLSRYSMCVTAVAQDEVRLVRLVLCPVSLPVARELVSRLQWLNWILSIFAIVHLASSISAKAVIRRRNMTGERLSPCLTPIVCGITADSFPIFRDTDRFE